MTLEFNDKTYELEYNLNRKLTPFTVKHFLALVEDGFYNGLCVHDYQTSSWYTGVYEYKEDTSKLVYRSYLDAVKKIDEKGNFSHSVWNDMAKSNPTYTLYGEFKSNGFEVQNGKVTNGFGALTMRYTQKDESVNDTPVWCNRASDEEANWKDYGYNSATSMFSINVSTTSTTQNDYCTFAELDEDSVEVLEELKDAIADYIGQEEDENFTVETEAVINAEDAFMHEDEVFFNTPVEPITISSMTVKKW